MLVGLQGDAWALQAELNHAAPANGGMESPLPLSHSASLSMSQPAGGTASLASSSSQGQQAADQQALSSSLEQVRTVNNPVYVAMSSRKLGAATWDNGGLYTSARPERWLCRLP